MTTIVLGAGVVGTATAWYLSKSGHEVVLLDRQAEAVEDLLAQCRLWPAERRDEADLQAALRRATSAWNSGISVASAFATLGLARMRSR